ncbi:hypothetical protein JTE90_018464 [Oedothorax gibbosus]|uniref:ubiquitinyl hydrolase 1 n=1 Tax=Oedothorax gibbosus TaxID=931172 RepID=A0AAV6UZF7_9ARAC|nr:hypothetical protein JTE90_018464 [Oedothorax gibbosus]
MDKSLTKPLTKRRRRTKPKPLVYINSQSNKRKLNPNKFNHSRDGTFRIYPMREDGNCLFRAMAYYVLGNQKENGFVRHLIARHISRNFSNYIDFIGEEHAIYLQRMYQAGEYGGHIEILAFTEIFGCAVDIYHQDHPDDSPLRVGSASEALPLIYCGITDSGHYNVLLPLSTPNLDVESHKDYIRRLRERSCRRFGNSMENFKVLEKTR